MTEPTTDATTALEVGARVEVRQSFDARWARGFQIAEVVEGGYRVTRRSDAALLPATFDPASVRSERARDTWWY